MIVHSALQLFLLLKFKVCLFICCFLSLLILCEYFLPRLLLELLLCLVDFTTTAAVWWHFVIIVVAV